MSRRTSSVRWIHALLAGAVMQLAAGCTPAPAPTPAPTVAAVPTAPATGTRAPTLTPRPTVGPGPGTSVSAADEDDQDGDGLPDKWETQGYDADGDGVVDWDLKALGASPTKKDIFVEIDWMAKPGPGGHSHAPKEGVLTRIVQMFATAPVTNVDGTTGINLHLELSNEIPEVTPLGTTSFTGAYRWDAFQQLKEQNFSRSKWAVWHYVILAHNYGTTTSSGISRAIPASDFIVSLGSFEGTADEQTGTIAHEFGHNLGLTHGGVGHGNYKPNYLSVMNYLYQMTGLLRAGPGPGAAAEPAFGVWDYSRWNGPALDETNLDERAGLGPDYSLYGTLYQCPGGTSLKSAFPADHDIDWNCNQQAQDAHVVADINGDGNEDVLEVESNWDHLRFDGGLIGKAGDATRGLEFQAEEAEVSPVDELTVERYRQMRELLNQDDTASRGLPPLVVEKIAAPPPPGQARFYSADAPEGKEIAVPERLQPPAMRLRLKLPPEATARAQPTPGANSPAGRSVATTVAPVKP